MKYGTWHFSHEKDGLKFEFSFLFFVFFPKQPTHLPVRAINIGKTNIIKHKYIALLYFKRKVWTNPNEYVPRKDCNSSVGVTLQEQAKQQWEEERKERTWKRKSPTVGVRVAWVGLNRCVHQSTTEKAHELVAFGVRAADSEPSRSFGALLRVSLRDVHLQLAREFESSSACMCCSPWWSSCVWQDCEPSWPSISSGSNGRRGGGRNEFCVS